MNYLVLLRHGQSEWNLANKFTGFHDVDLTEKGEQEAKKAGELLKNAGIKFDAVFSSTQIRANRTAEIVLNEAGQGSYSKVWCATRICVSVITAI